MDKVLVRRKPEERVHGKDVGTAVMNRELFFKISQGEGSVDRIKAFLVLPGAALYLAIMPGRVKTKRRESLA